MGGRPHFIPTVPSLRELRFAADSSLDKTGFEPSVPRVRDYDFETAAFERLITFCAVTKAIRISNPEYHPGTFVKIADGTVGSAGGNISVLPMRFVEDGHCGDCPWRFRSARVPLPAR
jgi:hypothetical protein